MCLLEVILVDQFISKNYTNHFERRSSSCMVADMPRNFQNCHRMFLKDISEDTNHYLSKDSRLLYCKKNNQDICYKLSM